MMMMMMILMMIIIIMIRAQNCDQYSRICDLTLLICD